MSDCATSSSSSSVPSVGSRLILPRTRRLVTGLIADLVAVPDGEVVDLR